MSGIIRKEDMHESFWQEEVSNPNLLINGDFQVWQRGNIINCKSGVQYAADRWALWCGNDGSIFENKLWYADWTVTGNDNLIQIIEMPYRIIGFDLTFSAQMRIPKGESVIVRIGYDRTGSVTDENNFVYDETVFVGTGEFKYYNFKINKDKNNSSYCKVVLKTALIGTISLANLKLEVGTNATKFISRLYGEELALCQRYYFRNKWITISSAVVNADYIRTCTYNFPVRMRTKPTVQNIVSQPLDQMYTTDLSTYISPVSTNNVAIHTIGVINDSMCDFEFSIHDLQIKNYVLEIKDEAYEFNAEFY